MSSLLILEFRDWRCFAAVIVAGHGVQAGGACAPASRDHDCCCRLRGGNRGVGACLQ